MPNDEWGTPRRYIDSARRVMGDIDMDPASNEKAQEYIQAGYYFTEKDGADTFNHNWYGNVWLNPPYGRGAAKPFVMKLIHSNQVNQAIVLTNNVTDTDWFADSLGRVATAFCFPDHRIQFVAPPGTEASSNSKGQVFSYLGDNPAGFVAEFKQYGLCVLPWRF